MLHVNAIEAFKHVKWPSRDRPKGMLERRLNMSSHCHLYTVRVDYVVEMLLRVIEIVITVIVIIVIV